MSQNPEANAGSVRIVSQDELPAGVRDTAVWESLQTHRDLVQGTRAWDPQVWKELEAPDRNPNARIFLFEPTSNRAHLLPHVGYVSAGTTVGIEYLLAS